MFDFGRIPHPVWAKVFIWVMVPEDTQHVIYLDADTIPLDSLGPLPDARFCARDTPITLQQLIRLHPPIPQLAIYAKYFNTGVYICDRSMHPLLEQSLKSMFVNCGGLREQQCQNRLINALLGGYTSLPSQWNRCAGYEQAPLGVKVTYIGGIEIGAHIVVIRIRYCLTDQYDFSSTADHQMEP
jgi:lipopolysaccharide biosynthesis glycosyltransferase